MTAEGLIDTSPKIAEYGKYLGRSNEGINEDSAWCYTEWYEFAPQNHGRIVICDNATSTNHTYQYRGAYDSGENYANWYYSPRRTIGENNATLQAIRFSILIENIDNVYAYCETTGQIFFAGKNTPYYGYRNLADMPEGSAS